MPSQTLPLDEWEHWIQLGQSARVREALPKIAADTIPRSQLATLADIARRCGEPLRALRWLNPYVRPSIRRPEKPTPEEKAEYAAALIKVGAREEALALLKTVDASKIPAVHLYRVYALMAQWDYEACIPVLKEYLAHAALSDSQRLIGKVNLAAALVHEHLAVEAKACLDDIFRQARAQNAKKLLGNALELAAQHHIFLKEWESARKALQEAADLLNVHGGAEALFVRKWGAILALMKNPKQAAAIAGMREIREEAMAFPHWETVRDCDRFIAIAHGDSSLLVHLYYGTPYPCFRQWMLHQLPAPLSIPEFYEWRVSVEMSSAVENLFERDSLKPGSLYHRLLKGLTGDFYRPVVLASLHLQIYPGEVFNPFSSPSRVHQGIRRLRRWLKEEKLPLAVEQHDGAYRLRSRKPVILRLPSPDRQDPWSESGLPNLRALFSNEQAFTADEAATRLSIPRRTLARHLAEACEKGLIRKSGSGPRTAYRFSRD